MSDGTTEAPARAGTKENGPTASSAPNATASAPARLRTVRRFTGAGESNGQFLLARELALRAGNGRDDPRGCRHSGQQGQYGGTFGPFFLFLVIWDRGP